jgi:hypothetical protein
MGAQGTTTINFGAFPGKSDTSVAVTGQASILAGSLVEAWLFPVATGDHSADEHLAEPLIVIAGNVVAGTGFTIYGFMPAGSRYDSVSPERLKDTIEKATNSSMPYGSWTVAWCWN